MQKIELYIQGQRVELFKDESITITESIQNVKDIEKVFTAFTQSFSVPASKTNNKIFKHYYNFDIIGSFDARKKVAATIELNSMPFQTGKIKLEGVDMKNNKPHTYRITFFGDIVELKDLLGEDKLSDLPLSEFNQSYSASNVLQKLGTNISLPNSDVIVPMITHTKRLYYDSGTHGTEENNTGNLYYEQGTGHRHGVAFNELKFAIRLNKIIEAIETRYGLTFSSDFFKDTNNDDFHRLYMWLHRKRGSSESEGIAGEVTIQPDFQLIVEDGGNMVVFGNEIILRNSQNPGELGFVDKFPRPLGAERWDDFNLETRVIADDLNKPYSLSLLRNGESIYSTGQVTGNLDLGWFVFSSIESDNDIIPNGTYIIQITTSENITFTRIDFEIITDEDDDGDDKYLARATNVNTANFIFNISQQIPNIGVLEFLTGLFKMFNLTAFFENEILVVKTLDDFYSNPTTYDITEFVDVNSSKVDVALPYSEISFKFKDTKSFFASIHGQLFNTNWGEIEYRGGAEESEVFAGRKYKVENAFGKMKYEELFDANDNVPLRALWGWCVDDKQGSILIAPLLFYPLLINLTKNGQVQALSYVNSVDANGDYVGHEPVLLPFNMPSNARAYLPTSSKVNINYNNEINEYTGTNEFTDTLFEKHYKNYIQSVFNPKQRLTKLKAYLPLKILLNYNLGDRFIVAGNQYKINSISTNLLTGESNLELLNDL